MRTLPIFKLAGNVAATPEMEDGATGAPPERAAAASVLSQNFCTPPFYSAYEPLPSCALSRTKGNPNTANVTDGDIGMPFFHNP